MQTNRIDAYRALTVVITDTNNGEIDFTFGIQSDFTFLLDDEQASQVPELWSDSIKALSSRSVKQAEQIFIMFNYSEDIHSLLVNGF